MTDSLIQIIPMTAADWSAVAAIYRQGIDTGTATFAACPPATWQEWSQGKAAECRLVARQEEAVLGWAALSPISSRPVYRGVAEVSIYVAAAAHGRGVGKTLLQTLIQCSEAQGFWTLQAGIFPENSASLELHLKLGFRLLGIREKIGYMSYGPNAGQWRDVAFLERRSRVTGI